VFLATLFRKLGHLQPGPKAPPSTRAVTPVPPVRPAAAREKTNTVQHDDTYVADESFSTTASNMNDENKSPYNVRSLPRPRKPTGRRKSVPYHTLSEEDRRLLNAPPPSNDNTQSSSGNTQRSNGTKHDNDVFIPLDKKVAFDKGLEKLNKAAEEILNNSFDTEDAEMVVTDQEVQSALWKGTDVRENVKFTYCGNELVVYDVNSPPPAPCTSPAPSAYQVDGEEPAIPDSTILNQALGHATPTASRAPSVASTTMATAEASSLPVITVDEAPDPHTPSSHQGSFDEDGLSANSTPFTPSNHQGSFDGDDFSATSTPFAPSETLRSASALWTWRHDDSFVSPMSPFSPVVVPRAPRSTTPETPTRVRELIRDRATATLEGSMYGDIEDMVEGHESDEDVLL